MPKLEVDIARLDPKSLTYLFVLHEEDGEATTRDLTRRTGMTNNEVHYRHGKLEDMGLVEVDRPGSYVVEEFGIEEVRSDGTPNIARLTRKGEQAIDEGLLEGHFGRDADIVHLSQRFDGFRGRLNRRYRDLEARVERLEQAVDEV